MHRKGTYNRYVNAYFDWDTFNECIKASFKDLDTIFIFRAYFNDFSEYKY